MWHLHHLLNRLITHILHMQLILPRSSLQGKTAQAIRHRTTHLLTRLQQDRCRKLYRLTLRISHTALQPFPDLLISHARQQDTH